MAFVPSPLAVSSRGQSSVASAAVSSRSYFFSSAVSQRHVAVVLPQRRASYITMLGEGDQAPSFSDIPVTSAAGKAGTVSSKDIAPFSVVCVVSRTSQIQLEAVPVRSNTLSQMPEECCKPGSALLHEDDRFRYLTALSVFVSLCSLHNVFGPSIFFDVGQILFYPRDMTSGCTCVANEMTAMLPEVESAGAKVFGISPDSIESHDAFIAKEGLGFPLIADIDGVVTSAYGAWKSHPTFGQVINRSSFIVKDGVVVKEFRGVSSGGHADDVVAALKAL